MANVVTARSARRPFQLPLVRLFEYGLIAVAVVMRLATTPTANLSYMVLAAYALTGRVQAIQALALSWLFTMLSPGIGAEATLVSVGRYAVIFGAALSVFLHSGILTGRLVVRWPVAATVLLGAFFVLHSLFVSPMVDVSILKATSWMVVMATLLSAWLGLSMPERNRLTQQIFGGLIIVLIVSLPLLVHPLGYLRNNSGFQGILNHPQAFGPTMALLGAWAASQMFARIRPSWNNVVLVAACLVLVLLSEARTAGIALVLAVGIAIITAPALSGQSLRRALPGLRSKRVWSILSVAMIIGIVLAPRLADTVQHYITKSGRTDEVSSLLEAYERSRGHLIDEMWLNINEHPFAGIGFGIASEPYEMHVERDPVLGLPVSASIEKGVMPLAVLEELGIVGFSLVALWLWMLIRRAARGGTVPLAVISTVLLLNMGESIFFSPGGMGLLPLILVGWAFASGRQGKTA